MFLTFPVGFSIPIIFSNLNCNCSNVLEMRNLLELTKNSILIQKLYKLFTVPINCSSYLKNSWPSTSNFKSFSRSIEQFFLTVGQNNLVTMIFCYQNCSDLLWEKVVLVIEKNFWISRLKAENLQKIWDH